MSDEKNIQDPKKNKKKWITEKLIEQQNEAKIVRKIVFITALVAFLLIVKYFVCRLSRYGFNPSCPSSDATLGNNFKQTDDRGIRNMATAT